MKATIKEELKNHIEDRILDYIDSEVCDLHQYLFNEDYYIIGTYQANEWLKKHKVSPQEALGYIIKEEKEHIGEMDSDRVSEMLESDEKLVNNYVYWLGADLLDELESIGKNWNRRLDKDIAEEIMDELE